MLNKDPLVHVSDREMAHQTLCAGGRVGVGSGVGYVWEELVRSNPVAQTRVSAAPGYLSGHPKRAAKRALPCR